jgi:AdoMet-dependent heme synthase
LTNTTGGARKTLLHEVISRCSRLSIPVQVALELTYRCNLRCAHCYIDIDEPEELTTAEWRGVIDQLKAAGAMYLLFTGGEVMVRPDFLEIAAYARRSGFFVAFLTNCTRLTPDLARDIVELKPLSIATSLYGATAATHDEVTGLPGSFERTLNGIRLLVDRGLPPIVQTLAMRPNLAELSRMRDLVAGLGAEGKIDIGLAPSKSGRTFPFRQEAALEDLVRCGWRPDAPGAADACQGNCKAGKAMCSISPGGNVFPCVMFPLQLGNLRKNSFNTIWGLEPCAELRYLRSIKRADLEACGKCNLAAYCHRCTGVAYTESGQMNGPSQSACRQAEARWRLNQATEVTLCQENRI